MRYNLKQPENGDNSMHAIINNTICNAKTRSGHPCKTHPVKGRKRCRMHGGTNNGAPKGNRNALKHGYYSQERILARSRVHKMIRDYRKLCKEIDNI